MTINEDCCTVKNSLHWHGVPTSRYLLTHQCVPWPSTQVTNTRTTLVICHWSNVSVDDTPGISSALTLRVATHVVVRDGRRRRSVTSRHARRTDHPGSLTTYDRASPSECERSILVSRSRLSCGEVIKTLLSHRKWLHVHCSIFVIAIDCCCCCCCWKLNLIGEHSSGGGGGELAGLSAGARTAWRAPVLHSRVTHNDNCRDLAAWTRWHELLRVKLFSVVLGIHIQY